MSQHSSLSGNHGELSRAFGPSKLYVFQQVDTPAQTSKRTQEWLGVKQGAILVKEYMASTKPVS